MIRLKLDALQNTTPLPLSRFLWDQLLLCAAKVLIYRNNTLSESAFATLNLKPELLTNLSTLGYGEMTPIQAQSLPPILEGKDVIARSQTGSGKTAAFGLGLLQKLEVNRFRIQTLVLCPTRELADQVAQEIRRLARGIHNIKVLTLCGGMPLGPQAGSLEHGAHIIVGTPGRIEDHLGRGTLSLNDVNLLVLDEADRMLEMGFQDALENIVEKTPDNRQTLLFSATFPKNIEKLTRKIMNKPLMAEVESTHDSTTIEQHFYKVENSSERFKGLCSLLLSFKPRSTLVFCNTKIETQRVADQLIQKGFTSLALHGDLEQRDRDETLLQFANGSIAVLAATDVAARGLDIDDLDAVVNYEIAHDPEVHTHRIGRTGRAGSSGLALSLFDEGEAYKVAMLEEELDPIRNSESLPTADYAARSGMTPAMVTLLIDGGKKQKVRAGDILGALTGENGIAGKQVGKIKLSDNRSYVAVERDAASLALAKLSRGKIKGRSFRARLLEN